MTPLPRTRIIPIGDFYTRLQLEYICYKFRLLIYSRACDKKKFADICAKKREKIAQIALENRLPSIFNDIHHQRRYLEKFFGQMGLPAFCYRDEYQARVKGYWDVFYYYAVGSSVRYSRNNTIELGHVKECVIKSRCVTVQTDEEELISLPFDNVSRIFPSTFYAEFFSCEA